MHALNIYPTKGLNLLFSLSLVALLVYHYSSLKTALTSLDSPTVSTISELTQQAQPAASSPALLLFNSDALVVSMNDGTAQLIAHVRDAEGKPVAGVTVAFASQQGTLAPVNATTNAEGAATTTFTAGGVVGQALINAQVADLTRQANVQIIKPNVTDSGHSLTLNLGSSKIDPGQQLAVTAVLLDATGQPLAGELVSLFGSLGEVSPASAVSDANGSVAFTYHAGTVAGQAMITVLAGYAADSAILQVGELAGPPAASYRLFLPTVAR